MRDGLIPGVNVDQLDIPVGIAEARSMGYTSGNDLMVIDYALARWARGEESGAQRTFLRQFPGQLTQFFRILAAAKAAVTTPSGTTMSTETIFRIDQARWRCRSETGTAKNEDNDDVTTIAFDNILRVLEFWKQADENHRAYYMTGGDDPAPEAIVVVWIDTLGNLASQYLEPFWDGTATQNAYDVSDLVLIAGIDL